MAREFWKDYCSGQAPLMEFFSGAPAALGARVNAVASWDSDLLQAVGGYQQRLGLQRAWDKDSAVIITGQQPGLLTGPLFTPYKAMTAVLLAEKMTQESGRRCVPVFWIAADDHDFEEVRAVHLLSKQHEHVTLRYEPDADMMVDGAPMYRVPLAASLHTLIEEAARITPGSEHRATVTAFLHESLDASASMADWFARIMARLFQDTPLLFFTPVLPEARAACLPILEEEVENPLETTRLIRAEGDRLQALGYPVQLVKSPNQCAFFLEMGERRRRVFFEDAQFVIPDEQLTCAKDEMRTLLRAAPERFSPNAALRCVAQQSLFPAAAYVAGPGELAYWAQLKPVFERHALPMPILYPRMRGVLMGAKTTKLLDKFGLSHADAALPEETLLDRALRAGYSGAALAAVARRRQEMDAALQGLAQDLAGMDTAQRAVSPMLDGVSERVREGMDRLEQTLLHLDAVKSEAVRNQIRRIQTELAPGQKPQERVYSVFSFLFAQGWDFIPRLLHAMDVNRFDAQEVAL